MQSRPLPMAHHRPRGLLLPARRPRSSCASQYDPPASFASQLRLLKTAALQIDSARKLRWYDREDLKPLVESNLRDKQLLHDTVAALRQVVQSPCFRTLPASRRAQPAALAQVLLQSGQTEAALDHSVQERLGEADSLRAADEGVNSVLLAACLADHERLQRELHEATTRHAMPLCACTRCLCDRVQLQMRAVAPQPAAPCWCSANKQHTRWLETVLPLQAAGPGASGHEPCSAHAHTRVRGSCGPSPATSCAFGGGLCRQLARSRAQRGRSGRPAAAARRRAARPVCYDGCASAWVDVSQHPALTCTEQL